MATIDSVKLHMSRSANRTGWNMYCKIYGASVYTADPDSTSLLGTSNAVAVDSVPLHGSQDWITFTFSTPVTISSTGFYGVQVYGDIVNNYQLGGVYVYDADGWSDATSGEPYTGKERGYLTAYTTPYAWAAGNIPAYQLICTDNDGNSALTPLGTYETLGGHTAGVVGGTGIRSYLVGVSGPAKATNPSPADSATTDGCYDRRLSWNAGEVGIDSYDVFIGDTSGDLTQVATAITNTYFVVDEADFPKDSDVYWRVDSTKDSQETTGDEWTFNPLPSKTTDPVPANGFSPLGTSPSRLYWDQGTLNQKWDVYFGPTGNMVKVASDLTNEYWDTSDFGVYSYIPLEYGAVYQWRVDAVNVNGTTTGDTWSFTTVTWTPPAPSTSPTKAAGGGAPGGGDTFISGANFIASNRRLIAACASAIFYEPYDEDD